MTKALFLLAAAVIAAPVAAQSVAPAPPIASDSKKSDVNKVVCQAQEEIGSRLNAKKVCMTVQEWQEYRAEHRENAERWQQSAQVRPQ